MSGFDIQNVHAWEAFDSRGRPTVGCEVVLSSGTSGTALAPSGASTGTFEAVELRDGDPRYHGSGVRIAVGNIRDVLAGVVRGLDARDQRTVDQALRACDGTPDLGRLGANAVVAVSAATVVAAAVGQGIPLFRSAATTGMQPLLPLPMVNIVSGGAHAAQSIDIQDFLAVPVGAQTFSQAIEWAWRVRTAATELVAKRGLVAGLVADEGGLGPVFSTNREALELVTQAIEVAGLQPGADIGIAIDVAAGQLRVSPGQYRFEREDRTFSASELAAELADWASQYPIVSVEDAVADDDWVGWQQATASLGHLQLLGDDLFATDCSRLRRGIRKCIANAVLVKPNQTGTLSGALDVVEQAHAAGYATVLSARSGDTEDTWLADLAVAWRTGQIKVGSITRSERTAKWNRLLYIESILGDSADFAGRTALAGLR